MQLINIFTASLVLLGTQVFADGSLKVLHFSSTGFFPLTNAGKVLDKRDAHCQLGSCSVCFGTGYTACPDTSGYCYIPGDFQYGYCPGDTLPSCASLYGPTIASCPDGSHTCYDAALTGDALVCPGSISESCTNTSSCAVCFGSGYIDCPEGSNYCYNPSKNLSNCPGTSGSVEPLKSTIATAGTTTASRTTTTSLADAATTTSSPTTSRGFTASSPPATITVAASPTPQIGAAPRTRLPLEGQHFSTGGIFGMLCGILLLAAARFIL